MPTKLIKIRVSAGAKTEKVEEMADGVLKVRVHAVAEKGKANTRVLEVVAEYFHVPVYKVSLVSGGSYREKVLAIES